MEEEELVQSQVRNEALGTCALAYVLGFPGRYTSSKDLKTDRRYLHETLFASAQVQLASRLTRTTFQ